MCIRARLIFVLPVLLLLAACSGTPTTKGAIDESIAAMGGAEKFDAISTLVMKGGGTRTFFGQGARAGDPGPNAALTNLVEVYDYAGGRAAHEYNLAADPPSGFKTQRREVVTRHGDGAAARPIAYTLSNNRVLVLPATALFGHATHASPEIGMRRTYLSILRDARGTAVEGEGSEEREFNGKTARFGTATTKQGEALSLYFDPETKLLVGYEIAETHQIVGDIRSIYTFEDFKPVDGVPFPHRVKIQGEMGNVADIQYTSVAFGDASAEQMLTLPESAAADAAAMTGDVPLQIQAVAPGIFHARGASHNSMIVEFPSWLAVVEAPQAEVHIKTLDKLLKQQFPDKPVRYVALTHPHHDHIGGLRTLAALGATVLVEKHHAGDIGRIVDARYTHPADELERRRAGGNVGTVEIYEGSKVISDGGQTLELHPIPLPTHVETMVVAYVPKGQALFQSDLNPQTPGLYDTIVKLKLRPTHVVGGHGGVTPFADYAKAARSGS